ncbi:DNA ligase 4-like isoform X2 [Pomacea canaliculata]|uniref:DNA ligase 4-like isoform X2 n=1 Tax=Pomacea canaliculata TaxID=400727 RepID=UPI000D72618E|nr:DNA ligase 4-like isoform X2 [Pomacea canaliculata]
MADAAVSSDVNPTSSTVASLVPFAELCGLLEKISKTQGNDKKKRVLKDFVDRWRNLHDDLHKKDSDTTMDSFYPAMRLLLPHLERERMAYGVKENGLARLMIKVLCLAKDSQDAQRLLNYRAVKTVQGDAGDFASMAYFVLKTRCPSRGSLTIQQELKMGLSQASVFSVYHTDAEDFFNVNNSLEKVCRLLRNPATRMHEIGISIFSPFTPMLGDRGTPDKVEKLMEGRPYLIETKFDGERVLLHKDGEEYKYFSRSGNEYTSVFGATPFDGTLTPYIANCFKPEVKTCILDGEMLGYHSATKTFGSKGEQFDIKSRDVVEAKGYQPCVMVFDILLYNDHVLTNLPLRQRLEYLEKVIVPVDGRILLSQHKEARTNQDCVDALNDAIDNREEGIMVKDAESTYRPNTRKGGWWKLKPEYVGGLMDELDLLIIGGFFGEGHRGGMMSHFLCGVAVPEANGEEPKVFYSFCKVGSGYSKNQLREFNQRLAEHWQVFDKRKPPACIELASGFKEKPDAWIQPDKSCIVQVKAAEIIVSERFKVGYTLRFPRVEMIRDDKPWHQCMTTADIEDLRQKSGGKLAGSRMELAGVEEGAGRGRRKRHIAPRVQHPKLMARFQGADVSNVTQVSHLLSGREICVINGPSDMTKDELERKVAEMGGIFVQNPGKTTFCILAEKTNVKVTNLIKTDKYDIVKVSWFQKLLDRGQWVDWTPSDMIHASAGTRKRFLQEFDQYGDSFTEDISEEQLKDIFHAMDHSGTDIPTMKPEDIAQLEEEYFSEDSPYGLFRTCRIYMDSYMIVGNDSTHIATSSLDLLAIELRFFGATISSRLDSDVSHVLVDKRDLSRLEQLKIVRRGCKRKFHIVTEEWVRACLEEGTLCAEKPYEL